MKRLASILTAAVSVLISSATRADCPEQLFKLLADDGAEEDAFGVRVAISGTTAIVGASWDDDNGPQSGSAYLYDTATGRQIAHRLPKRGHPCHSPVHA